MFLRFSRSSKNSEVFGVLEVFEVCLSLFFQTNYKIDFCTNIILTKIGGPFLEFKNFLVLNLKFNNQFHHRRWSFLAKGRSS